MQLLLIYFSSISFLGYGLACLLWRPMRKEYVRYGVASMQYLVGTLQIAGGIGLLVGFAMPLIGKLAAAGIALLMLFGVGIRIRIKDTIIQTLPAFSYLVINSYIAITAFR